MREEVEEELGVKGRKLGGGRMCLMGTCGMDILSRNRRGFIIIHGTVS